MKKIFISILVLISALTIQAQNVLTPEQQLEKAQKELEEAKKALEAAKAQAEAEKSVKAPVHATDDGSGGRSGAGHAGGHSGKGH